MFFGGLLEFDRGQFEALCLKTFDYFADESALDAVWLNHDERAFGISGHCFINKRKQTENGAKNHARGLPTERPETRDQRTWLAPVATKFPAWREKFEFGFLGVLGFINLWFNFYGRMRMITYVFRSNL